MHNGTSSISIALILHNLARSDQSDPHQPAILNDSAAAYTQALGCKLHRQWQTQFHFIDTHALPFPTGSHNPPSSAAAVAAAGPWTVVEEAESSVQVPACRLAAPRVLAGRGDPGTYAFISNLLCDG